MRTKRKWAMLVAVVMTAAMLTTVASPSSAGSLNPGGAAVFTLTILHNNDGESKVVNAGTGTLALYGGAARFKTLVDNLKTSSTNPIMVSSGDNFLAGSAFNASLAAYKPKVPGPGQAFYDTIAMEAMGYDAVNLGNHDFDFGPDVLAQFLEGYGTAPTYLSANLDFTLEPGLQAYVTSGVIKKSKTITVGSETVGVVGAIYKDLGTISSPRRTIINDVKPAIESEIAALKTAGVNKIILVTHLQSITNEIALVGQLSDVDAVVSGGGDELLADPGDLLLPETPAPTPFGSYPYIATDKDGKSVPIVTTPGEYRYVGQLALQFDSAGVAVSFDDASGLKRVSGNPSDSDAVAENATVKAQVVDPVVAAQEAQASNVLAVSQVALDGRRNSVRSKETNEGNLVADALLSEGKRLASSFGVKAPQVALQNGGGLRKDELLAAGNITQKTTLDMVPFPNFLSVVQDVPAAQFKEIMENAVSRVETLDGRFAQIAGFKVVYDPLRTAQVIDGTTGVVTTPGNRIRSIVLDSGTVIVENGVVKTGAVATTVATIDFLAKGGDQYPFRTLPFTTMGLTYQQALDNYIKTTLGGSITAAKYPASGEGRTTTSGAAVSLVDPTTGQWMLDGAKPFYFGVPGDVPFLGDWNGDGIETPGLYRASTGFAYIRNSNTFGVADVSWFMGIPGDIPLVGDWDGDNKDSFGVYRPSEGRVYLRNSQTTGFADVSYLFGNPGDKPFAGDFDGNGKDEVGLQRATGFVYFRLTQTSGFADSEFYWGLPSDLVFAGDWNGDGKDTVGLVRPSEGKFYFRNTNTLGAADGTLALASATAKPVYGRTGNVASVFAVNLTGGATEIPAGDPDGTGTALVTINGTEVCFDITLTKVDLPATLAHIHSGAAGATGSPVVNFDPVKNGLKACVKADSTILGAIVANPPGYYVNVHNAAYPSGAVRGQLG